jgi:L-seryl-tRNA(Ser) seleniumtransferase
MTTFREIPSVEQLRQRGALRTLEDAYGRDALVDALRAETASIRARMAEGETLVDVVALIEAAVPRRLEAAAAPSLRPVINATGVIVHTNLGRAPLSPAATARLAEVAAGYSNLEYDLEAGGRGRRDVHAERLLCRVTGAQAAIVVNNNAAAALIALAAMASGREVLISRGELVEIGGGFRVPDVLAQSGARLREVGTTNRTRIADYAAAISEATGLILRVHPSNFRIEGFTERAALADLIALGRRFRIPVVEDAGSGYVGTSTSAGALRDEPDVRASVRAGADLVTFSGDKLLGGPQAGIIVGESGAVARVRRHPLMRALRADKLTYAALEATLEEHCAGRAERTVPVTAMLALSVDAIAARAAALVSMLATAGHHATIVDGMSTIGGGSAPGSALPTRLVAISGDDAPINDVECALRRQTPAVIARIEEDRLLFDLRTVRPDQDQLVSTLLIAALDDARGQRPLTQTVNPWNP